MPITNSWHTLSGTEYMPAALGVYELGNKNNEVVFIGRGSLSHRIGAHASASASTCIGRNATKFRYEQTASHASRELELFAEFKETHRGKRPACNVHDPWRF